MAVDGITKNTSSISVPTQNQTSKASEPAEAAELDQGATKIYQLDALSEGDAKNALGGLKSKALEGASDAATQTNIAGELNDAVLKTANKISNKVDKLLELREKGKDTSEQAIKLQKEIEELVDQQATNTRKAAEFNQSGDRAQRVNYGSQLNKVIEVPAVKSKDYSKVDITSVEGLKTLKQESSANKAQAIETKEALKETTNEVAGFVKEVRSLTKEISGNVDSGFAEASKTASDIHSSLQDLGADNFNQGLDGQLSSLIGSQAKKDIAIQVINSLITA